MKSNNVWTTFIKRGLSLCTGPCAYFKFWAAFPGCGGRFGECNRQTAKTNVIGGLVLISDIYSTIAQEADGTWKLNANQSYQYRRFKLFAQTENGILYRSNGSRAHLN